jgi:hypothetical protein
MPAEKLPEHDELVRDLKTLREKGLIRLRSLELPALRLAAITAGESEGPGWDPLAIEALLRKAVAGLGGETMGEAAEYLFGLVRGTIGWRPKDLRERAAGYYGLSLESFRKEPEHLLIGQVAEEILKLCHQRQAEPAPQPVGVAEARPDAPGSGDEPRRGLLDALQRLMAPTDGPHGWALEEDVTGVYGPFHMPIGRWRVPFVVHLGPIEALTGVDVVVSSENVHLQPAKPYKSSLSARLRHDAARRDATGAVVDDVLARELAAWLRAHGRQGLPVEPGTVVPTSSGELVHRGIKRIYHAAVVSPRVGTNEYDIDEHAVVRAVQGVFQLARAERQARFPSLRSVCLPLFGTGRGGLNPAVSFGWTWVGLRHELAADGSWELHVIARRPEQAISVLHLLLRAADG